VKVVERSTPTILLPIDLCDGARRTKSTPLLSTGRACSRCGRLSRGSSSHRSICWSTRNVSKRQQFRSRRLSRETPNLPASLPPPFSQRFRGTHWCERSMNVSRLRFCRSQGLSCACPLRRSVQAWRLRSP